MVFSIGLPNRAYSFFWEIGLFENVRSLFKSALLDDLFFQVFASLLIPSFFTKR